MLPRHRWAKVFSVTPTTILAGEFFNMTLRERNAVLELRREHWPGQIITRVGSAAVGDAIDLLKHAQSHTDYLAVIPLYFFASPPQEGAYTYFRQLLVRSDLPLTRLIGVEGPRIYSAHDGPSSWLKTRPAGSGRCRRGCAPVTRSPHTVVSRSRCASPHTPPPSLLPAWIATANS